MFVEFGKAALQQQNGVKTNTEDAYDGISSDQLKQLRAEEARAVDLAEKGELQAALDILDSAVERSPNFDSLYNNRFFPLFLINALGDIVFV